MNDKENGFPAYRKYVGISVWFKIETDTHFIEIKQIGSRFVRDEILALQYPEMVLIKDMLTCYENRWEKIDEAEFERVNKGVEI